MAIIDEIRINGQESSDTIVPIVAGLTPVITWDYVSDAADPAQSSIEIKVSTTNTNWGTDDFYGGVLNISDETSSNFYEYDRRNLSRGTTYFGQIKATDIEGDETIWGKFSFTLNRLPFVTRYSLSPVTPTSADNIDVIYTYNDPDNHDQSGTKIRWFKNNLPVETYNGLCTLPASATTPGDSWTAKIIPSDGLEFGAVVETTAVVIVEVAAGISDVSILPLDANIDDILKVDYSLLDDEYTSFTGLVVIEWYLNDVLLPNSNQQYLRPAMSVGDTVYALVKLTDGESVFAQSRSNTLTIADVPWYVDNLQISGIRNPTKLTDLTPILEWTLHKSSALSELPLYLRVLITKTPSMDGAIYDTGHIQYVKNSHVIPDGILSRGQRYFFHIGAGDDTPILENVYITQEVVMSGSSWAENVDNSTGWTIEFKAGIVLSDDTEDPNIGLYIHDGAKFCVITLGLRNITFLSDTSITYTYPATEDDLSITTSGGKTFMIVGKGSDLSIFMNSKLVISAVGLLTNESLLKRIEYGDIDGKKENIAQFKSFRYSTTGAYGIGENLPDENTFYFSEVGAVSGGSVESIFDDFITWTPADTSQSSKVIRFNENSEVSKLPTVVRNYSPITSIAIDDRRNKFLGTANGVTAIYGEKHDPDYQFLTSDENVVIPSEDFDRISNVPSASLDRVEPNTKSGWFTIDTTYRSIGAVTTQGGFLSGDPYDPYKFPISSHAIHYYTQRAPGHMWYDQADNAKGWQVAFSFDLQHLEADDYEDTNIDKLGYGIYINDGARQEIVYFYEDRLRLYYANVYVPLTTSSSRDYVITGKDDNLFIYQKLNSSAVANYTTILDGSGLFTTSAVNTGSSHKPKVDIDSVGIYHAVWHDDGNRRSQIMYSYYDGDSWSTPEVINNSINFNIRNPSISIDSRDRIWVAYEDTSWGNTEISVSVKDSAGWNPKVRVTNFSSTKGKPDIAVDVNDNVHLVWEDNRDGHDAIYWAEWDDTRQTWLSSGQFGEDTPIMLLSSSDAYQIDDVMEFRNPKITTFDIYVFLVAEGHFISSNVSAIYIGYRDLNEEFWNTSGSIIRDDSGAFSGWGQPRRISDRERSCLNPSVCAHTTRQDVVVVWEDHTLPIVQVWGVVYRFNLSTRVTVRQLTSQSSDCINPVCAFAIDECIIAYERNNAIYMMFYNALDEAFISSATGSTDILIDTGTRIVSHPALPRTSSSAIFQIVYDFGTTRTDGTLSASELPDFQLIGDATVEHFATASVAPVTYTYSTNTLNQALISNLDTKEFAFGDFSENVGLLAHWKDFSMYFGYDAKPQNIVIYNQSTVPSWTDDRVNDLFVDSYGNLITATHGGLTYYNVITNTALLVEGHTSEYSSDDGCTNETCLLTTTGVGGEVVGKLTTSVKWSGGGTWYAGTTAGVFYSSTAGQIWVELDNANLGDKVVNDIVVDSNGNAVIAAYLSGESDSSIFVASPSLSTYEVPISGIVKCLAIDEKDIIWAGTNTGLWRVDADRKKMKFDRTSGMRSSHVNDITIVNKYLRYIGTATGIEQMYGMSFTNFNVHNYSLLNDNINTVKWYEATQSLWVGALHTLHEITFRDPAHNIIETEIVQYDSSELSTESNYDRNLYYVLDDNTIEVEAITPETASVYINKNPIDFGYIVSERSVFFHTDMLVGDQIEVFISNKFEEFHDFTQKAIERSVVGDKRTLVSKMAKTSNQQFLFLSGGDKHGILLYSGESSLPFSTITLDTRPPEGCIEKLETLTRTNIRFKIISTDDLSGVDSYMLSNYPNFTSDGTLPLAFQPIQSIVEHDLGEGINNVFDSLSIPATVTLDAGTFTVGSGAALETWVDETDDARTEYLFAATSAPIVVFKYDPAEDAWTAIQAIDDGDSDRVVNDMRTIDNIIYMTTGSPNADGGVYKSIDGLTFDRIGSTPSADDARGIAGAADGTVYFGSSNGRIYSTRDSSGTGTSGFFATYESIGDAIYSLDIFGTTLIVGTGAKGRVYAINTQTADVLIVLDTSDDAINEVHIKDAETVTSPDQAELFAASSDGSTIYRANLDDLDFIKSYSSFGVNISNLDSLESVTLEEDQTSSITGTTTISSINDTLFKKGDPAWEFLYQHSEEIFDFVQYRTNDIEGIWVISATKVTKWTAQLTEKTVYLRLKDKAGNISDAPDASTICPSSTLACCMAYKIQIADLKDFVHEGRIVDIDNTGTITYTYESPNNKSFFSADQIDQEVGIYVSEILNGSNDLVAWQSITWESEEPTDTSVILQIRSGITEDDVANAAWSASLIKNLDEYVSIEHVTDQYIQFRATLTSRVRDLSPSLSSVTLRNLTSQASHFFTTNFVMPSRPIKGLLTANTYLPVSSDVVFGINTKNSVDFGDYQIIEPNRLFTTTQGQFGENLRIGAKLLSPGLPQLQVSNNPGDPYDAASYVCTLEFDYTNISSDQRYHFRARFYNDPFRTQLVHTFFSGNDQTGWSYTGAGGNTFPWNGILIAQNDTQAITFEPLDEVSQTQKWYVTIEAYNGNNYETVVSNYSYVCSACNIVYSSGLVAEYYNPGTTLTSIPLFSSLNAEYIYIEPDINFSETTSTWETKDPSASDSILTGYDDNFAIRFKGTLIIPTSGTYGFKLESNAGSRLYVDSELVIDNDGLAVFSSPAEGSASLGQGNHTLEVQYFDNTGNHGIVLSWTPPSGAESVIPSANLVYPTASEYCDLSAPQIFNFAIQFELENGETQKINLTPPE